MSAQIEFAHARWWLAGKDDDGKDLDDASKMRANAMTKCAEELRQRQAYRRTNTLHHASLYQGFKVQSLDALGYAVEPDPLDAEPLATNVVRNSVRTLVGRITRTKIRPMFLTSGGEWQQQQKARKREKFIDGEFYRTKAHKLFKKIATFSAVWGTGVEYVFERDHRVMGEQVFPWELFADERDAYYGAPRTLYRKHWIDRAVLAELYPKQRDAIRDLTADAIDADEAVDFNQDTRSTDQLLVWTSWHLASSERAKDGRLCVGCKDVPLVDEPWTWDRFPLCIMHWDDPLYGFWGEGIARNLSGHQYEIGAMTRVKRQAMRAGVPKIAIMRGSQLLPSDIDDQVGAVLECVGQLPVLLAPPPINQMYVDDIAQTKRDAYEEAQVSTMAVAHEKPAGVNSGLAIQKWRDNDESNTVPQGINYEDFVLDVADVWLRVAEEIGDDYVTTWFGEKAKRGEEISLSDTQDDAPYVIQCYPTNKLPSDPTGRTEIVTQWFNAQLIDGDTYKRLLDFPDVEEQLRLDTAPYDFCLWTFGEILNEGEIHTPDPAMGDQALVLKLGRVTYLRAKVDGVPEDRCDLLRQYLDSAALLPKQIADREAAEQAANAPPPMPGAMPGAMPGPVVPPGSATPGMLGAPMAPPAMPPQGVPS